MLRRLSHLLQSKSLHGGGHRTFTPDTGETLHHDQDNERELLAELDRGELKLESVLIYYRMGQLLDTVNAALRTMLAEFEESGHDVRQVRSPFLGRPA
jgi:hypothetical protein